MAVIRGLIIFLTVFGSFVTISARVTPKVKCTPDLMRVEIPISQATKHVYLQGLRDYPDPACKPKADPTGSLAVFELNLNDVYQCATTRVTNKQTGKRVYYQTVITESDVTLDGIPVPQRETLHVKCSMSSAKAGNHTVTRRDVLPAGFQEAEEYILTRNITTAAPQPQLGVGVRQGNNLVTGELNVSPGTPLQMEIFLDNSSAPVYGILVTHMQVTDTKSQEETIIYNGCSVDPYLFDNFETVDGDFLSAKFKAFKFPESNYVQFKGTVSVCIDKCKGVECSDGKIGYGRRRRALPTLPADGNRVYEITVTSFIKVDSTGEDVENDITKILNKKLISGNQLMEKKSHRIVEEKPDAIGVSRVREEQYLSILEQNSSSTRTEINLVASLVLLIFRLLL